MSTDTYIDVHRQDFDEYDYDLQKHTAFYNDKSYRFFKIGPTITVK